MVFEKQPACFQKVSPISTQLYLQCLTKDTVFVSMFAGVYWIQCTALSTSSRFDFSSYLMGPNPAFSCPAGVLLYTHSLLLVYKHFPVYVKACENTVFERDKGIMPSFHWSKNKEGKRKSDISVQSEFTFGLGLGDTLPSMPIKPFVGITKSLSFWSCKHYWWLNSTYGCTVQKYSLNMSKAQQRGRFI